MMTTAMIFYSVYASAINDNTASVIVVNIDDSDDNTATVNTYNSCNSSRFANKYQIS